MATRMQQRRGTTSQWTSANPILAAGEIGFETDTGEFRLGDGINNWADLSPFKNIADLGGNLDDYVLLTEKGAALGVATLDSDGKVPYTQIPNIDELSQDAVNAALVAGTGITKTYNDPGNTITVAVDSTIATKSYADNAVSTHDSDTTNIHGITDTANLVYTNDSRLSDTRVPTNLSVTEGKVADGAITSAKIADGTIVAGDLADGAITSAKILDGTIVNADINASAAIAQSKIANLTTDLAAKAPLAGPTFTGTVNAADLILSGNLTVQGTTTTVSSANLELTDSLIYLSANQYDTDAVDIGIYGAYGDSNPGHFHTGLVRDASDGGKWKLISGGAEPTTNVVDFTGTTKDTLVVGALEATSATIGNVSNTELQYLDGVTSAVQTQLNAKAPLADPTFTGTVTLPSGTVTSAMLAGSIANSKLSNSSITLGSTSVSLGGTTGVLATPISNLNINTPTIIGGIISQSTLRNVVELTDVLAFAAAGTINYDTAYTNDTYYTSNATGNFTLNFRSFDTQTLNNGMTTGTTMTRVFRNTNGSTGYYPNVIQIDGTTVTPKWLGGAAPTAGNPNAVDVYTFVITKTASATFAVFASVSKFA